MLFIIPEPDHIQVSHPNADNAHARHHPLLRNTFFVKRYWQRHQNCEKKSFMYIACVHNISPQELAKTNTWPLVLLVLLFFLLFFFRWLCWEWRVLAFTVCRHRVEKWSVPWVERSPPGRHGQTWRPGQPRALLAHSCGGNLKQHIALVSATHHLPSQQSVSHIPISRHFGPSKNSLHQLLRLRVQPPVITYHSQLSQVSTAAPSTCGT